jgi:hypothetical protein
MDEETITDADVPYRLRKTVEKHPRHLTPAQRAALRARQAKAVRNRKAQDQERKELIQKKKEREKEILRMGLYCPFDTICSGETVYDPRFPNAMYPVPQDWERYRALINEASQVLHDWYKQRLQTIKSNPPGRASTQTLPQASAANAATAPEPQEKAIGKAGYGRYWFHG